MARPIKKGLDYFPLDVSFLQDIKIRKVIRACGSAAPTVIICILGYVYQDEGYFLYFDDDTRFLIAEDIDTTEELVDKVVQKALEIKFFDQLLFTKYKILTSTGIQNRYKQASYKKTNNTIRKDFDLLNPSKNDNGVSGVDNPVSDTGNPDAVELSTSVTPVSDVGSTQSKVKESKEKESKEKQSKEIESPAVTFQKTLTVYQQNIGVLNPLVQQNIEYRINDFVNQGTNEIEANEIVRLAIEKAALSNKLSWNYADGILKNWLDHSLFTLSNVKAEQKPKTKNEPYSVDESDKLPY
ncbi:DnaD domain protein [Companilactobacillus tucceti DSM 20183]|uniref:DnaD domain protein n=1 Tax=Companilactobacillus tucceti DSM 20183 TaxID=1423811 RepID=A0A0R1IYM5_9LACO|nr:Lin1244/Lin1753 domain-containing protein [Companilactobacillus tucceti]KRK64336.1 DnaD domain protein [Companilactobacillus tucceti DSM 20183]